MNDKRDDVIEKLIGAAGARPGARADQKARVEAHVYAAWQRQLHSRRVKRRLWWSGALAAGLLAFAWLRTQQVTQLPPATLIGTVAVSHRPFSATHDPLIAGSSLDTGPLGGANIALASGVELRVDQATSVELLDATRLRLLTGRIYVDSHDSARQKRSVLIETPFGTFEDTGTQFELQLQPHQLRLRVREGSVQRHAGAAHERFERGVEFVIEGSGATRRGSIAAHDAEWGWAQSLAVPFRLDGATLASFLDWATREQGMQLRYESDRVRRVAEQTVLHGSMDGLSPQAAIDSVLATTTLRTAHRDNASLVIATPP